MIYLGDSVYAEKVHDTIRLTTENGFGATNEIFLDHQVIDALLRYIKEENPRKES